jgi:hypothetical protein
MSCCISHLDENNMVNVVNDRSVKTKNNQKCKKGKKIQQGKKLLKTKDNNNTTREEESDLLLTNNNSEFNKVDEIETEPEIETETGLNKTNKELYDLVKFTLNKFAELHEPNISREDMYYNIFKEVNKHYKIAPKKRQRRIIPENNLCMGRKLDTLQCTRRRLNGKEYCKSHCKKLTNGRIDAPVEKPRVIGKRGRKRKTQIDPKYFDENYKTFFPCVIKGEKYLSDINNHIFKFIEGDNTKVKYLGVLSLDGKIESIDPIMKC